MTVRGDHWPGSMSRKIERKKESPFYSNIEYFYLCQRKQIINHCPLVIFLLHDISKAMLTNKLRHCHHLGTGNTDVRCHCFRRGVVSALQ